MTEICCVLLAFIFTDLVLYWWHKAKQMLRLFCLKAKLFTLSDITLSFRGRIILILLVGARLARRMDVGTNSFSSRQVHPIVRLTWGHMRIIYYIVEKSKVNLTLSKLKKAYEVTYVLACGYNKID